MQKVNVNVDVNVDYQFIKERERERGCYTHALIFAPSKQWGKHGVCFFCRLSIDLYIAIVNIEQLAELQHWVVALTK